MTNVTLCYSSGCVLQIVFTYSLHDITLVSLGNSLLNLGIKFDRELNFHSHVVSSCCIKLQILGFVRCVCSEFMLMTPLKLLYFAFFRSVLEHAGAVIWGPYTTCYKNVIKIVQQKRMSFAGFILKIYHPLHDYIPIMFYYFFFI